MRLLLSLMLFLLVGLACSTQPKAENVATEVRGTQQLAAAKDCNEDSFCTREYLPTSCQFSGQSFDGSNHCEAKKLARRYACEKDLKFADADVSCKSKEEPAVETTPAAPAKKGKGK